MSDALREQPFTVDPEHRKVRSFALRQGRAGDFVDCLGSAVRSGERTATDGRAGAKHQGRLA